MLPAASGEDNRTQLITSYIVKTAGSSFYVGELISNSSDFALGFVCSQHWEAVEGAASFRQGGQRIW
jgi:hypothetical protein